MQKKPLVSVLMTVFNTELYLEAAIQSILDQTFSDWEFIIVDDASTDGSLEIATRFAHLDSRIQVITNTANKGQTACLNQGLDIAQGEWIARQDADDLSHPQRLEKQVERVRQEPSLALLGTSGVLIDHHDHLVGLLDMPLTSEVTCWSAGILNPFIHTSVLFQADVVRILGGYQERYRIAQDYDLWVRIIIAGYPTANLAERLVSYRYLISSLSQENCSHTIEEAAEIVLRVEKISFGRILSEEERSILAALRRGLKPSERKLFWSFYNSLQSPFPLKSSSVRQDFKRLTALLHLKVAGAILPDFLAFFQEILAAIKSDYKVTFSWLWQRLFKSF